MELKLLGRNAVITGASKGIGRAIAKAFAKEGANILITYKADHAAALSCCSELRSYGINASSLSIDMSNSTAYEEITRYAIERLGIVDILVNNVGAFSRVDFLETTTQEYHNAFEVNMRQPFFLTQSISKHMRNNNVKGSIINISSLSAVRARSRMVHYQASKAALNAATEGMAAELGSYGIRINTISPGLTATASNKDQWGAKSTKKWDSRAAGIPLGRTGVPEDYAGAAIYFASDDSKWVTGANIIIDGGMALL
ncbi:SDR family NAD(P)-dependent oxidoreductase [Pseudomonas savastanoi]|nr:glucose 1-dehydrogenase [Pseudomonas savastanoi]KPX10524.1 hypothetical protein ALO74_101726 [Pseudomonas syringae pv. cunninghamiae]KPX37080.1 hypothetical protein ALO37_200097 [Pseudomonas savastanoi pv. glycinea]MCQ3008008.1 glucose 1-dehydrogenase [Pseudomonas savastanoi]PYD22459.1 3-oxoacyl-ACP reductase [Pseudomonas savastanoi pv. glycinea]RML35100.1 hypothetical protein ALQ97_102012 [Pseudomonas savastanoi pv. glycinea]